MVQDPLQIQLVLSRAGLAFFSSQFLSVPHQVSFCLSASSLSLFPFLLKYIPLYLLLSLSLPSLLSL